MANWGLAGDSFILPSPWELVTPPLTTTTSTIPPPIGPLGFSITTTTTTTTTPASVVVKTGPVLEDVKVKLVYINIRLFHQMKVLIQLIFCWSDVSFTPSHPKYH